jgi:hypothetical protein
VLLVLNSIVNVYRVPEASANANGISLIPNAGPSQLIYKLLILTLIGFAPSVKTNRGALRTTGVFVLYGNIKDWLAI